MFSKPFPSKPPVRCAWIFLSAALALGSAAMADTFVNFEDPQTKPITVFTVVGVVEVEEPLPGGDPVDEPAPVEPERRTLLAVANTPDNSVEIYDANFPWTFLARVRSGIGPVTVRWNAARGRLYVCNFSGDSVAMIRIFLASNPTGPDPLEVRLERIVHVGDEPSDIAFSSDNLTAFVTLGSQSGLSVRNSNDLSEITALDRLTLAVGTDTHAVKMPRQIWIDGNDRKIIANLMGEIPDPAATTQQYDLDLYVEDAAGNASQVTGLGNTHHAFDVSGDGSRMFVVGTRAKPFDGVGVSQVSQLKTGFVESWLWTLDLPPTGAPTPALEAPAGVPSWPTFQSVNLNRDYTSLALEERPKGEALSQPTDVLVVSNTDGSVNRLYLAAFHSDKIASLRPDTSSPGGWDIRRVNVPVLNSAAGYSVAGPRGLAYGRNLRAPGGGTDSFLFVANRLDNTVFVLSASSETQAGHFALQNDPTPDVVRIGREHLYDADGHSGTGFVTCGSCHVDGRTDGLLWNLGGPDPGPAIGAGFHELNGFTLDPMPDPPLVTMTEFPEDKGGMITQTLLGLVNYPTNEAGQGFYTNAPYHWRGDKPTFDDFNEAFVNLQTMTNVSGDPADPKGLSDAAMRDYRLYVNTLRHPPNPDQDPERVLTGSFGADPNDPTQGSGTSLGMQLFMNEDTVGLRSCVDCHSLPEGSSNTSPLSVSTPRTVTTGSDLDQPMETAALRAIRQRERRILTLTENLITANLGLMNDGVVFAAPSLENFTVNFQVVMPGPDTATQIVALIEFVQQFDTGIAPSATRAHTLGQSNDTVIFDRLEGQVREANIGLAVYVRDRQGVETGYWLDTTLRPEMYREEGTSNLVDRPTLEGWAAMGATVILQACPLGTERRWASALGTTTQLSGTAASNIVLEAMAPATHWVGIPALNQFAWQKAPNNFLPQNSNMWARDQFQQALIPNSVYGVPGLRHEPPRRFRVTGDDIRPGAQLLIGIPTQNPKAFPVQVLTLDLYPTRYTGADGRQIWETSEEMDPLLTLAMLSGGPWAPDVAGTFLRTIVPPATPNLVPDTWNGYLAVIQNEDGTLSNNLNTFHVLSVQDGR